MTRVFRRILKASRIAHLYLTLFGLTLILFFAVTGFMLNHENWFLPPEPAARTAEGSIPAQFLDPVDKFEVSEAVRRQFHVGGAVNSFHDDEGSIEIEFLRPGERAVAQINKDGETTVNFETTGWAGVMTDLHKGKSSGKAWSLVIDAVCILLLLIAATGLVLWSSLKTRGKLGALVILLGAGVAGGIYFWVVP